MLYMILILKMNYQRVKDTSYCHLFDLHNEKITLIHHLIFKFKMSQWKRCCIHIYLLIKMMVNRVTVPFIMNY